MLRSAVRLNLFRFTAIAIATGIIFSAAELLTRFLGGAPATFLYSGSFRDRQTDYDVIYGVTDSSLRVTCGEKPLNE